MNIFPPHNFYPCNNPTQNCYPCPSWCYPSCPKSPLFSEDEDCFTSHPLFSYSQNCNPTCMLKNPISPLLSLVIRFIIVFVFVLIALALLKSSKLFKNFKIPQFLREIVLKFIEPNPGALDPQKTSNLVASTKPLVNPTGRFNPAPPFFLGNNFPPIDPFFFQGDLF